MSLLGRLFGSGGATPPDDPDPSEEGADAAPDSETGENGESAYTPTAAHAQLLARVRREAEADAVRHAEDMLDRQFPIADEAETIAEARLAALQIEFIAKDAELGERRSTCERQISAAADRLAAIGAALRKAGIPADQVDAGPLRPRRFAGWKVAAGLATGLGLGYVLAVGDAGTLGIAAAVTFALALSIWLYATGPEDLEERLIVTLRESRAEVNDVLVELGSEVARIEIEREALRGETRATAENEIAFAGRLAAAYASAAFSAMPAGALEGGREFAAQNEPSVGLPGWVLELETVA